MMTTRIGLMGFGRIGRNVMRLLHNRADLDIVAISDIADPEALTYLLKYDSIYGRFPRARVLRRRHPVLRRQAGRMAERSRARRCRLGELGVDVVLETTSRYRTKAALEQHLKAGAKKVVLTSSPEIPGEIPLLLRGINDDVLGPTWTRSRSGRTHRTPQHRS